MTTLDDFEDRLIRHGVLPAFEETQRADNRGDAAKIAAALDALKEFVEAEQRSTGCCASWAPPPATSRP